MDVDVDVEGLCQGANTGVVKGKAAGQRRRSAGGASPPNHEKQPQASHQPQPQTAVGAGAREARRRRYRHPAYRQRDRTSAAQHCTPARVRLQPEGPVFGTFGAETHLPFGSLEHVRAVNACMVVLCQTV